MQRMEKWLYIPFAFVNENSKAKTQELQVNNLQLIFVSLHFFHQLTNDISNIYPLQRTSTNI
jgi:hypothetical protein